MKTIIYTIVFLMMTTVSRSQTWVDTWNYEMNGGQTVHQDSTFVGPKEMCMNSNHTIFAIVVSDQDQTEQLVTIDSSGIQSATTISHSNTLAVETCYGLHPTFDNGYVYSFSHTNAPYNDYKVIKSGGTGPSWMKDYPTGGPPSVINDCVPTWFNTYYIVFLDSLVEVSNNGSVIRSRSPFSGDVSTINDSDFIHFEYHSISRENFNGTIKWSIPYSYFYSIYADTSVIYADNGITVMKIHTIDGSIAWSKTISHYAPINLTADGGFITTDGLDVIAKYDSSGNLLFSRSVPFPSFGYTDVFEINPGIYIAGGAYECAFLDAYFLYRGFSYFLTRLDSTMHGVVDSTDHFFIGNANDNNILSFSDDAPFVAASMGSSGIARSTVLRDLFSSKSVFGTNWTDRFSSGLNYKYSDIDGNGIIDTADIRKLNDMTPFEHTAPSHWRIGNQSSQIPDLKILIEEDSVLAGDSITIDIIIGDNMIPADSIYAFGLTLYSPPLLFNTNGNAYIPVSNFGNPSLNLYSFFSNYAGINQYVNFVASREDHQNVLLNGDTIAKFRIAINNLLTSGVQHFNISYNAITFGGYNVPMNLISDSVTIINTTGIDKISDSQINLFPNPSTGRLSINSKTDHFENAEFVIYNSLNQKVFSKKIENENDLIDMDIQMLTNGIYSCHLIVNDNNQIIGKLSVIH